MGWDTNLDGVVDIPVSTSQGFTVLYIPILIFSIDSQGR